MEIENDTDIIKLLDMCAFPHDVFLLGFLSILLKVGGWVIPPSKILESFLFILIFRAINLVKL